MYVLVYLFGWSLFLWLLLVCERLCVCVPCLRYPRKGKTPRVYCYYNNMPEAFSPFGGTSDMEHINKYFHIGLL